MTDSIVGLLVASCTDTQQRRNLFFRHVLEHLGNIFPFHVCSFLGMQFFSRDAFPHSLDSFSSFRTILHAKASPKGASECQRWASKNRLAYAGGLQRRCYIFYPFRDIVEFPHDPVFLQIFQPFQGDPDTVRIYDHIAPYGLGNRHSLNIILRQPSFQYSVIASPSLPVGLQYILDNRKKDMRDRVS